MGLREAVKAIAEEMKRKSLEWKEDEDEFLRLAADVLDRYSNQIVTALVASDEVSAQGGPFQTGQFPRTSGPNKFPRVKEEPFETGSFAMAEVVDGPALVDNVPT